MCVPYKLAGCLASPISITTGFMEQPRQHECQRLWFAFCLAELLTTVCVGLIALGSGRSFDLLRRSLTHSDNPVHYRAAVGYLIIAASATLLGASLVPRFLCWRWSACSAGRLRRYVTITMLIPIGWAVGVLVVVSTLRVPSAGGSLLVHDVSACASEVGKANVRQTLTLISVGVVSTVCLSVLDLLLRRTATCLIMFQHFCPGFGLVFLDWATR